jgi:CheY-like chemotaxis protein
MQEAGQQFARVQHAELRHVADELAAADRRKNHFLALLAHELRNPLAAVLNGVEVLKRLGTPEPRVDRVQSMIERQVRHQARLLDDLLDVSRITCGKILLRREDLDLVSLAQETVQDYEEEVRGAGLALTLNLPEGPIWVNGDRTRLSQILSNLLSNSAKFTGAGGQVTVRMLPDPEQRVTVTVSDTGIGIEPELLPRIFDPFAQADHSLDHPRGGLGLGLALVKGLVELHGGQIRAESPGSGQGATFTFQLPLAEIPGAGAPAGAAPVSPRSPVERALRILVIEDNSDAAQSLSELLELLGHAVQVACSGPEGIEAARQSLPEVVLCDLGLPGINGYGVATALRWDPLTASIRLIAISGYAQEEDRRRARQAGFDLHVTKPVEIAELQRVLEATMDPRAL